MAGPQVRTDIVEVYVFRRTGPGKAPGAGAVEFLQLRRALEPLAGTWQPVMGHIEEGETAADAAMRELAEETGLTVANGAVLGVWQLEMVNTFFMARQDQIVMSVGFAVEVALGFEPRLDDHNDAARWVPRDRADLCFLWPGQRAAVEHITRDILPMESPVRKVLRIEGW